MDNTGYIIIIILVLIVIAAATLDIVNCQAGFGVTGKTTVMESLFGGSCRGMVLGTSYSHPINGSI